MASDTWAFQALKWLYWIYCDVFVLNLSVEKGDGLKVELNILKFDIFFDSIIYFYYKTFIEVINQLRPLLRVIYLGVFMQNLLDVLRNI